MELKDTINLMQSDDYKERFAAEYWQTKIRYEKLQKILVKAKAGTLDFRTSCPICQLEEQAYTMRQYLFKLEVRAEIEEIDLEAYAEKPAQVNHSVNAVKGDMLVREGVVYKVVSADEETFVIAKCYKGEDGEIVTRYDMIEAYCNEPSITTLTYMEFERYTPEVGS